jgi:hypothetical protein
MSGQREMLTANTIYGDSQVGRSGDNPTNGAAAHQVSTPDTGQIVGRMTCHSSNFTPISEGDGTRMRLQMVHPADKDVTV